MCRSNSCLYWIIIALMAGSATSAACSRTNLRPYSGPTEASHAAPFSAASPAVATDTHPERWHFQPQGELPDAASATVAGRGEICIKRVSAGRASGIPPFALRAAGLRHACSAGSLIACSEIAHHDLDIGQVYASGACNHLIPLSELLPRLDAMASAKAACGLGDERSCTYLADRRNPGSCPKPLAVDQSLEAVMFACPEDRELCVQASRAALVGCDGAIDVPQALKFLERIAGGVTVDCSTNMGSPECEFAGGLCREIETAMRTATTDKGIPQVCDAHLVRAKEGCAAGDTRACLALSARGTDAERAATMARVRDIAGPECLAAKKGDAGLSACVVAANAVVAAAKNGEDEKAAMPFVAHGCRMGHGDACVALGCGLVETRDAKVVHLGFEPPPAICKAACDAGDLASCLRLAGVSHDGGSSFLDMKHPAWRKFIATAKVCKTAKACSEAGENAQRGLMPWAVVADVPQGWQAFALHQRGCTLGDGRGCHGAAEIVAEFSQGQGTLAQLEKNLHKRGCDLGYARSCLTLAYARPSFRLRALKLLTVDCEAGDTHACEGARGLATELSDSAAEARLVATRQGLDAKACAAGNHVRCADTATRVRGTATACVERGDCQAMCDVIEASFPNEVWQNRERVKQLQVNGVGALVPGMSVEAIVDTCIEVALKHPCSFICH